MSKKAQAAMEFLMTYGWAIMVVLVVIGALAYFGVLNPSTLLPEKCTLPMMLNCQDHKVDGTTNTIKLKVQNGAGRDMKITALAITGDAVSAACSWSGTTTIANGETGELTASTCGITATGRTKNRYKITMTYQWLDSTYTHTMEGELLARTE